MGPLLLAAGCVPAHGRVEEHQQVFQFRCEFFELLPDGVLKPEPMGAGLLMKKKSSISESKMRSLRFAKVTDSQSRRALKLKSKFLATA
jgi:hypothetical protein